MKRYPLVLATLAALVASSVPFSAAQAQEAGHLLVRLGVTQINPQVQSGDLSAPSPAGTRSDVKPASQLSGGVSYVLDDRWTVDVPLALPFQHDLVGAGAIEGSGKLGDIKVLPATLLMQYRLNDNASPLRLYAGAGPTYAVFFDSRSTATLTAITGGTASNPTTIKVDGAFGASAQLGAGYALGSDWFVDGHVIKTWLKSTTRLSSGQTLDIRLDPLVIGVGVGRRF